MLQESSCPCHLPPIQKFKGLLLEPVAYKHPHLALQLPHSPSVQKQLIFRDLNWPPRTWEMHSACNQSSSIPGVSCCHAMQLCPTPLNHWQASSPHYLDWVQSLSFGFNLQKISPVEQRTSQVVREETGPVHLETLCSPFSFSIPAVFESSAKGKFPAMGSHGPASSSLCSEGTLDIWLLLVFVTHCCAQEQRLPRHLFCSSRSCDREALHTHSSPAWFLSPLSVAATAGNSWGNSCEATYSGILKVMAFFTLLSQGWMEK